MSNITPNSIDISVPKYEWIELPSELTTDFGVYLIHPTTEANQYLTINDYTYQVDEVIAKDKRVLEDLKSLGDIDHIIQTEYNHSLSSFCKGFFRKNYNMKVNTMTDAMLIENLGNRLEKLLTKFDNLSSSEFKNYELNHSITEVVKKVKLGSSDALFETEEEALLYFSKVI
ncbi:hypothetical protein [Acinetobacter nectaris]|uniref:hypothetical protein n=1 Tax=Acinetobacter nectaris TaxID=1219382 RepID=UPI001F30EE1B|nr:hypothetical protein [Acinetobacter nectaris]MCF9046591.1 hypothetical protein [Acinetobacter nectaris]